MTETHPQTRHLGYARVSTYGQTLEVQVDLFAIVEQIVDANASVAGQIVPSIR